MDVVFTLTLQYNPPDLSYQVQKITQKLVHISQQNLSSFSCLTWQKVGAPVYIRGAQGGGSDDLSRFWSHQTENLSSRQKVK